MAKDAEKAVERFIERTGPSATDDGLPRIAGRLLGLFIVHGGPFGFAALAERLLISRGSVSTNVRVLRRLGLIEKTAESGDRQDHYQLVRNPYARMPGGYVERMQVMESNVAELRRELPEDWRESCCRLKTMQTFHTAAIGNTQALIEQLADQHDSPHQPHRGVIGN